jgi:Skp family chaperone for outer membrane proteins
MKASRLYLLAIATLALVAIFLGNSIAQTATAPAAAQAPLKVLVCDIFRVFNQYQNDMDLSDQYNQKMQVLMIEDKKKQDKAETEEKGLTSLKEGSAEYIKQQEEVEQEKAEHQVWRQVQERGLTVWRIRETQRAYDQIVKTIAKVAKDRGAQLVMYLDTGMPKTNDLPELLQAIERRQVIYSDDSLDVTDEVLKILNANYAAGQKRGNRGPAPIPAPAPKPMPAP